MCVSKSLYKFVDVSRDAGTGGGQEGQLPLLPFRSGKGGEGGLLIKKNCY